MNQQTPLSKFRLPTLGLVAITGLLIALAAIFVFKVAVGVVLNYGLFAVMILSHFWMHGSHGNHNDPAELSNPSKTSSQLETIPVENNSSQNRTHGCH